MRSRWGSRPPEDKQQNVQFLLEWLSLVTHAYADFPQRFLTRKSQTTSHWRPASHWQIVHHAITATEKRCGWCALLVLLCWTRLQWKQFTRLSTSRSPYISLDFSSTNNREHLPLPESFIHIIHCLVIFVAHKFVCSNRLLFTVMPLSNLFISDITTIQILVSMFVTITSRYCSILFIILKY